MMTLETACFRFDVIRDRITWLQRRRSRAIIQGRDNKGRRYKSAEEYKRLVSQMKKLKTFIGSAN